MSIKFTAVRIIRAQQVDLWVDSSNPWAAICIGALTDRVRSYDLIEIVSTGWASGARCRTKRCSVERALPYVNKLHAGRWIDDDEYDRAYGAIEKLLLKNRSWIPAEMGTPRYLLESELSDEGASSGSSGREAIGSSIEAFASPAHTGGMLPDVGNVLSGVRL